MWDRYTVLTGADHYASFYPSSLGAFDAFDPADLGVDVGELRQAPDHAEALADAGAAAGTVIQFPRTQRVSEPQRFADPSIIPLTVNIADALVLASSSPTGARRVMLQIQNKDPAADVYFNFGAPASVTNGITLNPGQTATFADVVPQNDLHLAASADAAIAAVLYAIKGDNE